MGDPDEIAAEVPAGPWQLDVDVPPPADGEGQGGQVPGTEYSVPSADLVPAAGDTEPEPDLPPPPERILEALLFAGGLPLSAERAAGLVRGLSAEQFRHAIDGLNRDYRRQGRPYAVQSGAAGYTLTLRPRFRGVREKLFGAPREARLSQPALDVLAVVAYRQPATRADIDTYRGADSMAVLRQLVRLGLVVDVADPARPGETAYGTTARFLELFGLSSLDDLPRTGDLQRL